MTNSFEQPSLQGVAFENQKQNQKSLDAASHDLYFSMEFESDLFRSQIHPKI